MSVAQPHDNRILVGGSKFFHVLMVDEKSGLV
jgi:hypothetical protein